MCIYSVIFVITYAVDGKTLAVYMKCEKYWCINCIYFQYGKIGIRNKLQFTNNSEIFYIIL
jgi:hypothetical protein